MFKLTKIEQKIVEAVKTGGKIARDNFGKGMKTYRKSIESDFFTKADLESEEKILEHIKKDFPNINILAEESGTTDNGSEYTFVLDPLDGTNNYALGIPYFSVAAALMKGSTTVFSCVYQPILDNLYYAKKGKGAFKNSRKIRVSEKVKISRSTLAYVTGYSNIKDLRLNLTKKLYRNLAERILDNWCPTLDYCLLASGKVECIIVTDDDLHESIIGQLIMKEAGALVVDFKGKTTNNDKENKFIAANNKIILKDILKIIKSRNS